MQLRRAVLVVADISGEIAHPRAVCERYYSLMTQYRDIHWVFMVSDSLYPLAVELLIRPESSLISESEPVNRLIEVICAGSRAAERKLPLCGDADPFGTQGFTSSGKGMGNQSDRCAVEKEQ